MSFRAASVSGVAESLTTDQCKLEHAVPVFPLALSADVKVSEGSKKP